MYNKNDRTVIQSNGQDQIPPDTERTDCQESTDPDTGDSTGINSTSSCTKSTHLGDINFPHKTMSYIILDRTDFAFTGPDNRFVWLDNLDRYIKAARIIRSTGVSNSFYGHTT